MRKTVLPNGIQVLTERMPGVRSAALGVWIARGSAHEDPSTMGSYHLLEHLVFKGTRGRSAQEIALALESLGGSLDAFTGREHTSFQARVLDEDVSEALDVLADLVLFPLLRREDLELEREVVLEEILTVQDTPDDLLFQRYGRALWDGHPYGQSILGTEETIPAIGLAQLRALHRADYRGGDISIAGAGRVDHEDMVGRIGRLFESVAATNDRPSIRKPTPRRGGEELKIHRDTAQTHIVIGTDIPGRMDTRRYPLVLLAAAFGGGMSSRLFQKIREEMALAYSIYSFQSFYTLRGVSGVYVGTRPSCADRTVDAVLKEFSRISSAGLTREELEQTKRQVKGQIMLSLESPSARLYRLADVALFAERYRTLDELLAEVDAVSFEETLEVTQEYFDPERQFVARLGPDA